MPSLYIEMLNMMLGYMIGFLAFIIILVAACYILYAWGLYTTAQRRGVENAWLAWIPVANIWLLGKLADTYNERFEKKQSTWAILMLAFAIISLLLGFTPIIGKAIGGIVGSAFGIMLLVSEFIAYYKVYNWNTQSAAVLIVFTVLFPVIIPFTVFFTRNGDNPALVDGAHQQEPPQRR